MSADAGSGAGALELDVARAVAGDREALESVIAAIQPDVHRIALRFLWHPEDAEDATQEILIRVMTRLETFRGESAFRTWVFRVASNRLLTIRAKRAERQAMSFEEFAADLESGLSEDVVTIPDIEQDLLLDEVRIGCTMAMLLCLERPYRLAYILGEIMELDHNEGAAVMDISPAAFRARVSRARRSIRADAGSVWQRRSGSVASTRTTCSSHRRWPGPSHSRRSCDTSGRCKRDAVPLRSTGCNRR
jgi:RNA polymerase sigma factor (sigma-70 family)